MTQLLWSFNNCPEHQYLLRSEFIWEQVHTSCSITHQPICLWYSQIPQGSPLLSIRQQKYMQDSRPHLLECKKAAKPPSMQSLQPPPTHRPGQNCWQPPQSGCAPTFSRSWPHTPTMLCPHETSQAHQCLWQGTSMEVECCPHERRQSKQSWPQPPTHGSSSPKPASCQCVDSPVQPLAPKTKSRLTVEAAGAASLCCCHDTLNGPFWHGPSWQWMRERAGERREEKRDEGRGREAGREGKQACL